MNDRRLSFFSLTIALLSCFSRLKTLTTESSVIVAALQKSKTGLLEISEDKTKIRRSLDKPLPEINDDYKDALKHKSVYIVSILIHCTVK